MVCKISDNSKESELGQEPGLTFSIVMAYEDFAAGKEAMEVYHRLFHPFENDYQLKANLWRFDILRDPKLMKMAAAEAAEADIVFIAAHAQGSLPEEAKNWMRRWLGRKGRHCGTLVALLDGPNATAIEGSAIRAYLRRVADRAQLTFFSHGTLRQKKGQPLAPLKFLEKRAFRFPLEEGMFSEQTGFSC